MRLIRVDAGTYTCVHIGDTRARERLLQHIPGPSTTYQPERGAMSEINVVTGRIVDAAYRIHKAIGPGLLESVYERVLAWDLARNGFRVERQKRVGFEFEGMRFEEAFRADLVVDGRVVVEVKSVAGVAPVHTQQLMTYVRLLDCRVGLLLNFGAPMMKQGIVRVVNGL